MDMSTALAGYITGMNLSSLQNKVQVGVASKALDQLKTDGNAILKLLQSTLRVPDPDGIKGTRMDIYA